MRVRPIKGRPADHPLIVYLAGVAQAGEWAAEFPEAALCLMARFWPGPLTLVLPARDDVPRAVTGGQDSVALRAPSHPLTFALLRAFGGGLAAPSANRFGAVSPTEAWHVRASLGDALDQMLMAVPAATAWNPPLSPCSTNARRCCAPARCRCLPAIPVRTPSCLSWTSLSGTARAVP